ncbi:D-glycero-beta-D-manno-heptose 1-phosphate adenylyltransferase [Candidatus Woesearchaeota archaeon]|nr:D-glycero-beta-D-manno-heptose 1-phosphate adenylyltransferase [Candidatus Woesearchaeota archaeon]
MTINKKIKTLDELIPIVKKLKKQNKKIVTTNGVFDILHFGHVKYLEEAKKLGDVLIVGVNTDASVKLIKGDGRPINGEESRIGVLAGLESVDYVFLFGDENPAGWVAEIKPDVHAKGGDYEISQITERHVVENNGGKVILIPMLKGCSTTSLINKILSIYRNQ